MKIFSGAPMRILKSWFTILTLCACASATTRVTHTYVANDGATPLAGSVILKGPYGSTSTAATTRMVTIGTSPAFTDGAIDVSLVGCHGCYYEVRASFKNSRGVTTQTLDERWYVWDTASVLTRALVLDSSGVTGGAINAQRIGPLPASGYTYASDGVKWVATAVGATTKAAVGLGNVDNTADADKPVSTLQAAAIGAKADAAATTAALATKAPINNPVFTGTATIGNTVHDGLTISCPGKYANLNACLDAAKAYVTTNEAGAGKAVRIILPDGSIALSGPYALASGMHMEGVMPRLVACGANTDTCMAPNGGTWIDCGGNPCFTATAGGTTGYRDINFVKVGFKNWTGAIGYFGGDGTAGLSMSVFEDVYAVGADAVGDRDGFIFLNSQFNSINRVRMRNVNTGIQHTNKGQWIGGNSEWIGLFILTYPKSVANGNNAKPGILIDTQAPTSGASGWNNLFHLVRPQVNAIGGGDHTGTGIRISRVNGVNMEGADVEGESGRAIDIVDSKECHILLSMASAATNSLYFDSLSLYNIIDSAFAGTTIGGTPDTSNIFRGTYAAASVPFIRLTGTGIWMPTARSGNDFQIETMADPYTANRDALYIWPKTYDNQYRLGFGIAGKRFYEVDFTNVTNGIKGLVTAAVGKITALQGVSTDTNCLGSVSPVHCSSAIAGSIVIPAGTTAMEVWTNGLTANSQILLTVDSSLGTRLGVTCNTTIIPLSVTARNSGGFNIGSASAPTTNPLCLSFLIVN